MQRVQALPLLLLLLMPLHGQERHPSGAPGASYSSIEGAEIVTIPPRDLRRASLSHVASGDVIEVFFQVTTPGGRLELDIMRREEGSDANSRFRRIASFPAAENMTVRHQVHQDGSYIIVLRQPPRARTSVNAFLKATSVRRKARNGASVRTLSPERRLAVLVFSVGLLWTTLLVCGTPIIRAFRSRRRPEAPPWYG